MQQGPVSRERHVIVHGEAQVSSAHGGLAIFKVDSHSDSSVISSHRNAKIFNLA